MGFSSKCPNPGILTLYGLSSDREPWSGRFERKKRVGNGQVNLQENASGY
jgi:hypothetical protein